MQSNRLPRAPCKRMPWPSTHSPSSWLRCSWPISDLKPRQIYHKGVYAPGRGEGLGGSNSRKPHIQAHFLKSRPQQCNLGLKASKLPKCIPILSRTHSTHAQKPLGCTSTSTITCSSADVREVRKSIPRVTFSTIAPLTYELDQLDSNLSHYTGYRPAST